MRQDVTRVQHGPVQGAARERARRDWGRERGQRGFRGWIVFGEYLYELHPADRDLTLAEGVALIRFFLKCGDALQRPRIIDGTLVSGVGEDAAGAGVSGGAAGGGRAAGGGESGRLRSGGSAAALLDSKAHGGGDAVRRRFVGEGVVSCGSASGGDDENDAPDAVFRSVAVEMAERFGLQVDYGFESGYEGE